MNIVKQKSLFYGAILAWVMLLIPGRVSAQLSLASVFSDGMVLQRNSTVEVWGWAASCDSVTVVPSWNEGVMAKTAADGMGRWSVEIETAEAGGPYELKVYTPSEMIVLDNVLLGEVWLCSGQSNMEWSANYGIVDKEKEVANADCPDLRIFHMPKRGALTPQNSCEARWEVSSPESMRRTSATAYFFGRYLSRQLSVPVGIIVSAWNGTPIEVWLPESEVSKQGVNSVERYGRNMWRPADAGVLYNQMIAPLLPYSIKGCIWYQGETNCDYPSDYSDLMKGLITSWREAFGNPFPFLYVQIAPYSYQSKNNGPALLRAQQEWVLDEVENTAMISVADLVENVNDIHPRNKRAIGERLAFMAMDKVYGKYVAPYESPRFRSIEVGEKKVILNFSGSFEYLQSATMPIVGLEIVDEEGNQLRAKVEIKGRQIQISTKHIDRPFRVRYCFDDATIGSLRSDRDIPVFPFCTEVVSLF